MKKYLAELSYGSPSIMEIDVVENEKTYKVISSKRIMGMTIWGKVIKKDDIRLFASIPDAIFSLEKDAKAYTEIREKDFKDAIENYQALKDISFILRSQPEKLGKILEAIGR